MAEAMACYHCLLLWWCCSEEGNGNKLLSSASSLCLKRKRRQCITIIFLCGGVTEKNNTLTMWCCLLLWWCCNDKGDSNLMLSLSFLCLRIKRRLQFPSPSLMALLQKKATTIVIAFFNGFVMKRVTATMSLPSSMVVLLWKRQW